MPLQVTDLVREFRPQDAQAYIDTYPFSQYQYQNLFPEQYTSDLTIKTIEATTDANVAADIVAFNSRAPRKGRELPSVVEGEISKIEIARPKTESDWNTYRSLSQSSATIESEISRATRSGNNLSAQQLQGSLSQLQAQIVDWVYGDTSFCANGVRAKLEWLAKQVASKGMVTLNITNNESGVQTKFDVDFGVPAANKANATAPWSDPASDPVADIQARMSAGRAKGKVFKYMFMDRETFETLASNVNFQKFAASFAVNALNLQQRPDVATANAALTRQGLPQIMVWDSYVSNEGKNGVRTPDSGWQTGMVTFSTTEKLGSTLYTMSADEFVSVGSAAKVKSGIVLVKTWAEEDPITVITKGVAYALPVLNGAKSIHLLKTVA